MKVSEVELMGESITDLLVKCPDCERFRGREFDLCTGVGHNGRPNPVSKSVTTFREQNGIQCDNALAGKSDQRKFSPIVVSVKIGEMGDGTTAQEPGERKPAAPPIDLRCIHRGEQVSTVGCATCGGGTAQVAIFACALHEECTITRLADDTTPVCVRCKDREPPQLVQLEPPA